MKENINDPNNNLIQGADTATQDSFNFPPPGHSLTDAPDQWAWDKQPRMSDPDKVVDFVIDKIDNNANTKEHFLRLMAGGTTVEEIVNTVALGGFTAGEFNPDVAEIIKPPLAVYFIGLAIENKVPVVAFNKEAIKEEKVMMSKRNTFDMMKERNPEEFQKIKGAMMSRENKPPMQSPEQDTEQGQGFINMGGQ
tara:strand:- start:4127 stop:4708 length:582 start_codon:yes stop_codon:yes gene_type:complete